jgi:hypothetical protein
VIFINWIVILIKISLIELLLNWIKIWICIFSVFYNLYVVMKLKEYFKLKMNIQIWVWEECQYRLDFISKIHFKFIIEELFRGYSDYFITLYLAVTILSLYICSWLIHFISYYFRIVSSNLNYILIKIESLFVSL